MKIQSIFKNVYHYCVSELKAHSVGVAAFVFAVTVFLVVFLFLRPHFFPNFMETNFDTDEERGGHMIEQLVR